MIVAIQKFTVIPFMIAVLISTSVPITAYRYWFLKTGQIVKVAV